MFRSVCFLTAASMMMMCLNDGSSPGVTGV
jgi:hypothetical protein